LVRALKRSISGLQALLATTACLGDEKEQPVPTLRDDVLNPQATRGVSASDDVRSPGRAELEELIWALPAAVYTTDAVGNITFYNTAAAELWGSEPELGTSKFFGSWRRYWQDGRPMEHEDCPMAVTLRTGKPVQGVEAVGERPDGTRVPFISYPTPLHDSAGRLIGAVDMLVDITERKMFGQAVQSHVRRLEILNGVAKVISSELDVGRIAQMLTDLAMEASGAQFGTFFHHAAVDEQGAAGVMQAVSPRLERDQLDIASNAALFDATIRHGIGVRSDDIRNDPRFPGGALRCRTAGKPVEVASYLAVPVGRLGRLHGALLLGHPAPGVFGPETEDFVSGIAAHAAIAIDNARLYQAERQLAEIVETSSDAIVSKDIRGIVRSWNRGAERLFGFTADEMIGMSVAMLIPNDRKSEEDRILERIKRGERVEPYETVRVRKDGTLVDVSLSVSPLRDAGGRVIGASKIARDITERKQALARQELLAQELHHRTKNLFAVVNSVVARSFPGKQTVEEAEAAVMHRLHSLAQMHVMLLDKGWQGADLGEVVRAEMSPYGGRVAIDGPPLFLSAQAAQNFALALHELATNAAKYGALSDRAGQVLITWSISGSGRQRRFVFRWEERGGPAVSVPDRKGFGSAVLEYVMAEYFNVPPRIEFAPTGLTFEASGSIDALKSQ
jgi:PAS domain S-box-containing protein